MNYIPHYCGTCRRTTYTEMHSNPDTHFPSLICEGCGIETEGCPCNTAISEMQFYAKSFASLGGIARAKKISSEERKKIAQNGANKRWKKY